MFVVATYGEGDPTDNAQSFHELLKEKKGDASWDLKSCNYAVSTCLSVTHRHMHTHTHTHAYIHFLFHNSHKVFGLGNKTYEKFNEVAIFVDKSLHSHGAHRLVKTCSIRPPDAFSQLLRKTPDASSKKTDSGRGFLVFVQSFSLVLQRRTLTATFYFFPQQPAAALSRVTAMTSSSSKFAYLSCLSPSARVARISLTLTLP
jgi:hypothetical protein